MRVQAIYDHGTMEFISPVSLRHQRFNVVVELPDEEVVKEDVANKLGVSSQSLQSGVCSELNQILGEHRQGNTPVSSEHDKQAWHGHLERKYMK